MPEALQNRTQKSIVLVGGGHTHALVLNGMRTAPLNNANVTVINPGKTAPYLGMLPGFVAGHYRREELDIDLEQLTSAVGAKLIDARAVAMDTSEKVVFLDDGFEISYDFVSFDVGITSQMDLLPGFSKHAVPAKPLAEFASRWDIFRQGGGGKTVLIIGGGIAGAELGMAMSFALRSGQSAASITLLDRGTALSANSMSARKHILCALQLNGVRVVENTDIKEVVYNGVVTSDGVLEQANLVIGAAGATPHQWIVETGLQLHEGFIVVDEELQSSENGVFAVGDCAHMKFAPRPKAGVYAVRQAPILLENFRRSLSGTALQKYKPQADYLKLVSLGGKRALGEKLGFVFLGRPVWMLKNWIDRKFMEQF